MNRNTTTDQHDLSSSSGHWDEQKGEPCVERDPFSPPTSYYVPIISHLLSQPEAICEVEPSFLLTSLQKNELLFQSGGNSISSREVSSHSQLPRYDLNNPNWFHNEHLQAKKARVENIVQGMSIMPNTMLPGILGESDQHHVEKEREYYRENKRKQKLPQQQRQQETSLASPSRSNIQADKCIQLKKQLLVFEHQLKQLQEKFLEPNELSYSSQRQGNMDKTMYLLKEKLEQSLGNSNQTVVSDHNKNHLCRRRSIPKMGSSKLSEREARMMDSCSPTSGEKTLSEVLKHELIQVVTQVVDSVLKKVSFNSPDLSSQLCNGHQRTVPSAGKEFTGVGKGSSRKCLPKVSSHKGSMPTGFPIYLSHSETERKPCQLPQVNCPLILTSDVQGNGILSQMPQSGQNCHWEITPPSMVSVPESLDASWKPVKLKSSVLREQRYLASHKPVEMQSFFPLPASKAEFAEMCAVIDGMPFPSAYIQETLTPGHLKKAKLMFFYTRYPTSSVLKAYFLDVQFTRCITSQLIKWFSNFREFYYIQMEKFARQAFMQGMMDPNDLIVSRDSELFRTLNVHYNKGNDFEVPDGFLDVASLTLQEFFSAVKEGKDLDPSWKKPIYKTISKLDREVPDVFKSCVCHQEMIQG